MSSALTTAKPSQEASAPKMNKKKANKAMGSISLTEIVLPKLEEMVLLQPIDASSDAESPRTDRVRFNNIRQELDKYNQCVPFANSPNIDTCLRDAATGMQRAVHDINSTISKLMKLDENTLDLQKQTHAFVSAVNIFRLSYKELDATLKKHPQRGTESQLKFLKNVIMKEEHDAFPDSFDYLGRPKPRMLPKKIMRLIQEIQTCPDGNHEAFQLCVHVTAHIFPGKDVMAPFGPSAFEADMKQMESLVMTIIHDARNTKPSDTTQKAIEFFNFAAAKREIWSPIPPPCLPCRGTQDNDPFSGLYFDPSAPCRRSTILSLLEILQIHAYNEIKSGIMLTLPSKLPKELCMLIFEHAMVSEEIALDPSVFKPRKGDGDGYGASESVAKVPKEQYLCLNPRKTSKASDNSD